MFGVRFIQTTGRCTSTFVLFLQSFGMSRWQSSLWLFCHCRLCDIRVCYNATSEQRSRHAAVAIGRMLAMTLSGYEWLWPLRFVECCLWRYPDMSGYDICDWSNVAYEVIQIWVAMTSTIGQMLPITLSRYKWLWHLRLVECCLWRYSEMSGYDLCDWSNIAYDVIQKWVAMISAIGRILPMTLSRYEWLWPLRLVECCLWRCPDMSGYDLCDWSNVAYDVIQKWVAMISAVGRMLPMRLSRYEWLWPLRLVECCLWRYPDMSGYDLSPPTSSACLRYERLKLQRKYYITAWACSSKHTQQPTSHHVFEAQRECVCRQTDVWISRSSGHSAYPVYVLRRVKQQKLYNTEDPLMTV